MKILVFDTETTGLPKTKEVSYSEIGKWPFVVQISYLLFDTDTNYLIKIKDHIIKIPKTIQISSESTQIHGITYEISQQKGKEWKDIIIEIYKDFTSTDLIIGHNLEFDLNILKIEMMRNILEYKMIDSVFLPMKTRSNIKKGNTFNLLLKLLFNNQNYYCTMQKSVDLCNIKKTNSMGEYIKFPKLSELHVKLFEIEPKHLHNSLNDVLICLRCFYKLEYNEDLLEKNKKIKNRLLPLLE